MLHVLLLLANGILAVIAHDMPPAYPIDETVEPEILPESEYPAGVTESSYLRPAYPVEEPEDPANEPATAPESDWTTEYTYATERMETIVCGKKYEDRIFITNRGVRLVETDPTTEPQLDDDNSTTTFRPSVAFAIGGQIADIAAWPWMVAILVRTDLSSEPQLLCGAALITDQAILTAAHCFDATTRVENYVVKLGAHSLTQDHMRSVIEVSVSQVVSHPGFRPPAWYNDIAILKLSEPVTFNDFIQPVCLPSIVPTKYGKVDFTMTGWGRLKYKGQLSDQLVEAVVPIISNVDCTTAYRSVPFSRRRFPRGMIKTLICAGNKDKPVDACQGDSGGPLVLDYNMDGETRWVLEGVVSSGFRCGIIGIPGIYTRVASYLNWINSNLAIM